MRLLFTVTLLVFANLLHADSSIKKAEDKFVKKVVAAAKKVGKMYDKKILAALKAGDTELADKLKGDLAQQK